MTTSEFDAILLGSGHNSLIAQAYLSNAGLRTLCLEGGHDLGGGLSTVEWPEGSGFLHNPHSFFHRGITQMPWYRDLDLANFGAKYLSPELNATLIVNHRECLQWWRDFDQTEASFASISPRDARILRQWRDRFHPEIVGWIQRESESPPETPDQRKARLEKNANGRLLLEISQRSPREFVAQEFEHPAVQAALLFFNGLREVDPRARGFGHHIPALISGNRMAEMCVGGSHQLAAALVARIRSRGGDLRVKVNVQRIVVDQNRVVGVQMSDGEVIHAPTVISGLNPQQTLIELIDESLVPSVWRELARDFRYNVLAPLFTLNVNLETRPEYAIEEYHPEVADSLMVILGIRDLNRFDEIVKSHDRGTIPPTTMWGSCPTRFDPSQAPAGRQTSFMWEKVPFRLSSDSWDTMIDAHVERMWNMWHRFAPNLADAKIDLLPASPRQIPARLPNMREGDLLVGALDHGQIGYHRPFPGAGHYRTCFEGLYLCGSCCHPGGNITGLPGYNAAQVIHSDLGLPPIKEYA